MVGNIFAAFVPLLTQVYARFLSKISLTKKIVTKFWHYLDGGHMLACPYITLSNLVHIYCQF
jgi:hypothetical protein